MFNICVFYFRVTSDCFQSFILSKCPLIGRFREYCSFLFSLTVCSHALSFQLIKNNNGLKALAHNSIVVEYYYNIIIHICKYFLNYFYLFSFNVRILCLFLPFFLFFTFKRSVFS